MQFKSRKAVEQFYRSRLGTDSKWAIRALVVIGGYQTSDELRAEETKHENGVGFTSFDAEVLTSLYNWNRVRPLTDKQVSIKLLNCFT